MKQSNKLIKTIVLFGAMVILFSACSPQQRMATLLKNHPELIKKDTIFRIDTIVITGYSVDTVFHYKQTDTVIVNNNIQVNEQTWFQKTWSTIKDYLVVALLGAIIVLMILQKKKLKDV